LFAILWPRFSKERPGDIAEAKEPST